MTRIESGVKPPGDPGSGDKLPAPSRREQLGGENRSRHHDRMIEGPREFATCSVPQV
jgi:hypothetical protein